MIITYCIYLLTYSMVKIQKSHVTEFSVHVFASDMYIICWCETYRSSWIYYWKVIHMQEATKAFLKSQASYCAHRQLAFSEGISNTARWLHCIVRVFLLALAFCGTDFSWCDAYLKCGVFHIWNHQLFTQLHYNAVMCNSKIFPNNRGYGT